MIATHSIKVNGKWHMAGDEISSAMPGEKAEINTKQYTKTEINRMSTEDLRHMALNTGVENAENMTGKELKEYLISVFGL